MHEYTLALEITGETSRPDHQMRLILVQMTTIVGVTVVLILNEQRPPK